MNEQFEPLGPGRPLDQGAARLQALRRARRMPWRSGLTASAILNVEAGRAAGLTTYARIAHALGMDLEANLVHPRGRQRSPANEEDPVHAAMGELEAAHLRSLGYGVSIDEPYQHYQFAGRADVIAWRLAERALLHLENRTRFPNVGEAAGAYNAKRVYLAPGRRRSFAPLSEALDGLRPRLRGYAQAAALLRTARGGDDR